MDPTFICNSYKKNRFYMFTRRMPVDQGAKETGRDMFNENITGPKATHPNQLSLADNLSTKAVLYTSMGEIHVSLYAKECPKTVENFTTHATKGYYSNIIFHRVIKSFMI